MSPSTIVEPFIGPVSQATIAFPIAASLLALPFALYHYRRHGHVHPWRAFISYSFIYYMITALFLVILPLPELPARGADLATWNSRYGALRTPQFDPTAFARDIVAARGGKTFYRALFQAIFNLLLLLPFGFYLVYSFKRRILSASLWGFLLSLSFELCQLTGNFWIYPGPYRLFDTGDLLLNTTGALLGALLAALLRRLHALPDLDSLKGPEKPWIGPFRRFLAFGIDAAALALTAILLFFLTERLGFGGDAALRLVVAAALLFWFVALPAIDEGRGLGKRFTFCAIQDVKGKRAGFLRILARQSIFWALPALAYAAPVFLPKRLTSSSAVNIAIAAWIILWGYNGFQTTFGAEHAGKLDRMLGMRVRNTWKASAAAAPKKPSPSPKGGKTSSERRG